MSDLPKQYDPKAHESGIYEQWETSGAFQPDKNALAAGKKPFVIMLPPPNITGSLHMGHALQDTIMDVLSRWHRMKGDPTLWVPGTDHAAIATNKVIENQLHEEGKTRHDIGREAFMERTQQWYEKTGAEILNQMKRLGCSCDWSRNRFTMDQAYADAVTETFIRYYEKGFIYRGARIVNWDPKTQTTVSDLEIDWQTEKSPFYTLKYGPFEISTARPETKFGDKYVVMHPEDERYKHYKHGDTFEAEWINGPITATIIKDEAADPEFGTGVMTITPWHDATDFEIARRHNLDMEQIIDLEGKLLPIAGQFAGQTITEARSKIVEKLEKKGLLVSCDEKYEHNVALNDRGKGMIEPQIMRQWFVDMQKLKDETIRVAKEDMIRFVPPRWKRHFIHWMEHVLDWNINRQIWLGHRLPVWWKPGTHGTDQEEGNFVVSTEEPEGNWEQDPDTLDTWFSSALWPFATLGWPKNTGDLKTFYPTSVLVTAREILYLWVARMVFSGLELLKDGQYEKPELTDRIPFRDVFIHPVVLAKNGQRMSKSLGTGIDPLELIEKYGADATRLGLMHQMNYDMQQMKFDEEAIRAARNFANKVWNIARLIDGFEERDAQSIADEWIRARLAEVTDNVTQLLEAYKIGEAARVLHGFVWHDFADWYLEVVKTEGSTQVARDVFRQILVLLHPFMPHVTEVLWQRSKEDQMLIVSKWPKASGKVNPESVYAMGCFQAAITAIRSARALLGIKPGTIVHVYYDGPKDLLQAYRTMAHATVVDAKTDDMKQFPLPDAPGQAGGGRIFIGSPEITEESMQAAQDKLSRDANKAQALLVATEKILANMRGRAPEEKIAEKEALIAQTKQKLAEIERSQQLLNS